MKSVGNDSLIFYWNVWRLC